MIALAESTAPAAGVGHIWARCALAPTLGRLAVNGHSGPVSDSARIGPVAQGAEAVMPVPSYPREPPLLETTRERHIPRGVSPRGPGDSRTRWRRARWNHDHR